MRRVLLVVLVACGGGSSLPDADGCEPPTNLCGGPLCGNGAIDGCVLQPDPERCEVVHANEICDGPFVTRTCLQLGYYGGTAQCGEGCRIDEGACDPCPPGTTCTTLASPDATDAVSNGAHVLVTAATKAWILDGALGAVAEVPLAVKAAVGVPGGWLVAAEDRLFLVGEDGAVSASKPAPAGVDKLVAGFGKVLVLATETTGSTGHETTRLSRGTFDLTGEPLTPMTELATFSGVGYAAVWNGASFFVSAWATLYRLDDDGALVSTASLPYIKETVWLFWRDGVGWWVGGRPHMLKRFDAAGQFFGTAAFLPSSQNFLDYLVVGNHLLGLRTGAQDVELVTVDSEGDLGTPRPVGLADPMGARFLADLGTDVVVAWPRTRLRVARVPAF